jgi:hypothetical protein
MFPILELYSLTNISDADSALRSRLFGLASGASGSFPFQASQVIRVLEGLQDKKYLTELGCTLVASSAEPASRGVG